MVSLPECSVASLEAHESLIGTATDSIDRWILLEVTDPWAPDALDTEALPEIVRARLSEWLKTPRSRLQLIRRPGRVGKRRRLMVISSDGEEQGASQLELDRYEDLLDVDPGSLDGEAAAPLWLVCVHGRRDRCCALHGGAVFRAMQSHGLEVWQTSHLGGHRFAACVLSLPEGLMYGRLRPEHVPGLVTAHEAGKLGDLSLFRGRCAYDKATQAAEIFLRTRLGADGIGALEWLGTSREGDSSWQTRFRTEGREHAVRVKREQTGAIRPPSCGADPEPVTELVET
ncbi:MAG TPA: sucrase ferredoxin [Polyangiales bacterium]|nr:sucrase ferredoxin [Polyangiales bacterium]